MNVKILVPLVAIYLAVCHAASSSAGSSQLERAQERLAAVEVKQTLEDLEATVDLGNEILKVLYSTSRHTHHGKGYNTISEEFSATNNTLLERILSYAYTIVAAQLSKSDYETFDDAAARVSGTNPKFSKIKKSTETYLSRLNEWKATYLEIIEVLKEKIRLQVERQEASLESSRTEMINTCQEAIELIEYDISQMGNVVQILSQAAAAVEHAPSAKVLPRGNRTASYVRKSLSSAAMSESDDEADCTPKQGEWPSATGTIPVEEDELMQMILANISAESRPSSDEEGTLIIESIPESPSTIKS